MARSFLNNFFTNHHLPLASPPTIFTLINQSGNNSLDLFNGFKLANIIFNGYHLWLELTLVLNTRMNKDSKPTKKSNCYFSGLINLILGTFSLFRGISK